MTPIFKLYCLRDCEKTIDFQWLGLKNNWFSIVRFQSVKSIKQSDVLFKDLGVSKETAFNKL